MTKILLLVSVALMSIIGLFGNTWNSLSHRPTKLGVISIILISFTLILGVMNEKEGQAEKEAIQSSRDDLQKQLELLSHLSARSVVTAPLRNLEIVIESDYGDLSNYEFQISLNSSVGVLIKGDMVEVATNVEPVIGSFTEFRGRLGLDLDSHDVVLLKKDEFVEDGSIFSRSLITRYEGGLLRGDVVNFYMGVAEKSSDEIDASFPDVKKTRIYRRHFHIDISKVDISKLTLKHDLFTLREFKQIDSLDFYGFPTSQDSIVNVENSESLAKLRIAVAVPGQSSIRMETGSWGLTDGVFHLSKAICVSNCR